MGRVHVRRARVCYAVASAHCRDGLRCASKPSAFCMRARRRTQPAKNTATLKTRAQQRQWIDHPLSYVKGM